ncbi:hypothetical protein [Hyphobacterium sp.]|uniref:tellurite resistance TerB family protein n=1 Tax=Hyphobacterium sp. TaxID=2004662 RepID=UPI003BAD8697
MHIILGLLGLLAAIGAIAWRINMARQGAEVVKDVAETAINLPRKMRFQSKAKRKRLSSVEDPREAAAILLLGMARAGGEVTTEHKKTIRAEMERAFDVDAAASEELLARASWYSSNVADPDDLIPRMTDFVAKTAGSEALASLSSMLGSIGAVEGDASADQVAYLRRYQQRAGLS